MLASGHVLFKLTEKLVVEVRLAPSLVVEVRLAPSLLTHTYLSQKCCPGLGWFPWIYGKEQRTVNGLSANAVVLRMGVK